MNICVRSVFMKQPPGRDVCSRCPAGRSTADLTTWLFMVFHWDHITELQKSYSALCAPHNPTMNKKFNFPVMANNELHLPGNPSSSSVPYWSCCMYSPASPNRFCSHSHESLRWFESQTWTSKLQMLNSGFVYKRWATSIYMMDLLHGFNNDLVRFRKKTPWSSNIVYSGKNWLSLNSFTATPTD